MNEFEEKLLKQLENLNYNLETLIGYLQKWFSKEIVNALKEAEQPDLEYPRIEQEVITTFNEKPDTEPMGGTSISPPKKGKYTWYPVKGGGKVRKCNNEPCPYFLKYEEELGTYQHGKYDPNTKVWSYITDMCEFYGEGK